MKFNKSKLFFILLLVSCSITLSVAQDTRKYILSKFHVSYSTDVAKAKIPGYSKEIALSPLVNSSSNIFDNNPNMLQIWERIVRKLINDPAHGGDEQLQQYVSDIFKITNRNIICYFIDDTNVPRALAIHPHAEPYIPNKPYGKLFIGSQFVNNMAAKDVIAVFLHELVHTQDNILYNDLSLRLGNRWYNYGFDDDHYLFEAVPSMAAAAKEGLANGIAMYFTDKLYQYKISDWFSAKSRLCVEKVPFSQSSYPNANPDIWLYDRLVKDGVPSTGSLPNANGDYACYNVEDLNPYLLIHNELIVSTLIYMYMRHAGYKSIFDAIIQFNNNEIFHGGGDLQTIMRILCQDQLPDNWKSKSIDDPDFCQSSGEPMKFLLILAYADYLTGFKVRSQQEFSQLFDNGLHIQLFDCYWVVRESVKKAASQEKDLLQASTSIASILGMNESK